MYLPDPIESMEASAERWADDNIKGNMFKCSCGKWCSIMDGETLSPDPYAIPVCPDCFNEWWNSLNKEEEK